MAGGRIERGERSPRRTAALASLATLGLLWVAGCGDRVTASGGDGAEIGLLIDGSSYGSAHNDDRATGPNGTAISVGPYDSGPGEVIAYTQGHAPTLHPSIAWTPSADSVTVPFDRRYLLPFKVWVLRSPFADGQAKAWNGRLRTEQIWTDERQGLGVGSFLVVDATAAQHASDYLAFSCSKASGIKSDIGFDPSAINVYLVDTVDFGSGAVSTNGVWCGSGVLALGWNGSDHLFTHEVGHALGLAHIDNFATSFDGTNVMHPASNDRKYLTEGQTFRAVTRPDSVVATLGGRSGMTRLCTNSTSTSNTTCPPVDKRIWADGASWPPN